MNWFFNKESFLDSDRSEYRYFVKFKLICRVIDLKNNLPFQCPPKYLTIKIIIVFQVMCSLAFHVLSVFDKNKWININYFSNNLIQLTAIRISTSTRICEEGCAWQRCSSTNFLFFCASQLLLFLEQRYGIT